MRKINRNYFFLLVSIFVIYLSSCSSNQSKNGKEESKTSEITNQNPAAEGFNERQSDAQAIALADSVMLALGGRDAWDKTRFISWNFFGFRTLVWDKWTGDVRIDHINSDLKILVNINTLEGKVFNNGEELAQPDSLQKYLQRGKEIWINDSYWLAMPFKLKDSGLTLKYVGEEPVMDKPSHILELTFENTGVTPNNKYLVYIDKETNLVNQWAFFRNYEDGEPGFTLPWQNYEKHGQILLSGDRGPRQLSDIRVFAELPESVFKNLADANLSKYKAL